MATEVQKEAIAVELAAGVVRSQVARRVGYSQSGLARLVATKEMKARIAEKRDVLEMKAQHLAAKSWMAADKALDNIIAITNDPTHRFHYRASVDILDRVWPKKSESAAELTINFSPELAKQVLTGVRDIKERRGTLLTHKIEEDPHLQDGEDAVYYEVEDAGSGQSPQSS